MSVDPRERTPRVGSFPLSLTIAGCAGFAGLVDEVVWARLLGLRLGTTSFASALVISAFVLGWGIGAGIAPRLRGSAGRIVATTQLAVGGCSLGMPLLLHVRLGGALDHALLALPLLAAVAMGVALPVLLGALDPRRDSPRRMGALQAVNAAGSVLGALTCGFFLLGAYGTRGAGIGAFAVHALAAGLAAFGLRGVSPAALVDAPRDRVPTPASGHGQGMGTWLAFLAGFSVVLLQFLGMRLLLLYFLGFGYVFAAVTAGALLSFSAGSFALADGRPERALRVRRIASAAVLAALVLALWPWIMLALPGTAGAFSSSASPFVRVLGILGHTIALLGVPIAVTAGWMPLAYAALDGTPRERAARVLLWNGLGAATAPFLGALVLVPALGVLATGGLLAVFLLITALALVFPGRRVRLEAVVGAIVACAVLSVVLVDAAHDLPWKWPWTSRALYERSPVLRDHPELELRFADEDANFAVAVVDDARRAERTLFTDNFRAASTGDDYVYMQYLGTLPLHLEPRPERVLVIAFGTGTTAGAIARSEQVKELDIVEISQTVIDRRSEFAGLNGAVDEERPGRTVRWHVQDGRRFLETTDRTFQAITLEPLLPYAPVAVHFYTREFHELCRSRLEPGGTLTHWIPATSVSAPETAGLVRTFAAAFEHAGLWWFGTSLVLVGSDRPLAFASGLDGVDRDVLVREALSWITDREGMLTLGDEPLLTDDWPWIEFVGLRSSREILGYTHDNLERLLARLRLDGGPVPELAVRPIAPWAERRAVVRDLLAVRVLEERQRLRRLAGQSPDPSDRELLERYEALERADPDSPVVLAETRRFAYEVFLRGTREAFAVLRRRGSADPRLLEAELLPVLRTLDARVRALRPYRFEPYLYRGALLWFLAHAEPASAAQRALWRAEARTSWLCAATLFPAVFETEPYRSELQPLLEGVSWDAFRRGAQELQREAQQVARAVRTQPAPAGFDALLAALRAPREGDGELRWLGAFRAVAIDRLAWRVRLREARLSAEDRRRVLDVLGPEF